MIERLSVVEVWNASNRQLWAPPTIMRLAAGAPIPDRVRASLPVMI